MNTTRQQIVKYARMGTGFVRVARNSPGNPEKLVRIALDHADKLSMVARTIPDDREAFICSRAGSAIKSMVHASFGYNVS